MFLGTKTFKIREIVAFHVNTAGETRDKMSCLSNMETRRKNSDKQAMEVGTAF